MLILGCGDDILRFSYIGIVEPLQSKGMRLIPSLNTHILTIPEANMAMAAVVSRNR